MGSAGHRRLTRGTALERVSRARLARNAAVALGNSGDPGAIEPLAGSLAGDASPLVREHAAWALGRLGPVARLHLARAAAQDPDGAVRAEATRALEDAS
jgi:epoxyqueuosine reductase